MTSNAGHGRACARAWHIAVISAALLASASFQPAMSQALAIADLTSGEVLIRQATEYKMDAPKTVVQLQQFRQGETAPADGGGGRGGSAALVNLNPRINAWLLLTLDWGLRSGRMNYHLENPNPRTQSISLAESNAHGIRISTPSGTITCDLWFGGAASPLEQGKRTALPYAPLCDGHLYLRNRVMGNQTNLERVTDFLRDHVWGGEKIISLVKQEFYADSFISKGTPAAVPTTSIGEGALPDWPRAGSVVLPAGDRIAVPQNLGVDLGSQKNGLTPGHWYPPRNLSGIYLSFVPPKAIDPQILVSYRNIVNRLDDVESDALAFLVAFDLGEFDLRFAVGTDHPRVGWSDRVPSGIRIDGLPGPDGINTIAPLVGNAMVSPWLATTTVAAFTGGFKRQHGAFKYGKFAGQNRGSHYGFIEQGIVLSKLVPGLATVYVLDDASVDMKTWTTEDDALLPRVRYARQNGVALIEFDPATGISAPGPLVAQWGPGNWSGSDDEKLRTLRAGICLQQTATKRFLLYGYFSSATPSAMARVFQAYGCRYAMHLDMNALEHTYLALYVHEGNHVTVQHLVQGMEEVDKKAGSEVVPRFLGFPDDRDFFYLTRREQAR